MERFSKALFSMPMMALGMLIFLGSIGWATILEANYDIQTAKILIYNALWFEILLAYLCVNLIANIFRYRMIQAKKIAMLSFHLSFIIIIIGAGITRFFGFEGLMLIPEGTQSNSMYLADPHLWIKIHDGTKQLQPYHEKLFMSEQADNYFYQDFAFPGHQNIRVEYVDFKKKQIDSLVINDDFNSNVLDIVTDGMKSNYLAPNNFIFAGDIPISYNKQNTAPGIDITSVNGTLMLQSKFPLSYLPMSEMQKFRQAGIAPPDSLFKKIPTDSVVPFYSTTLYVCNGQQFVFKQKIDHAKVKKMSSGKKDVGMDILTLRITDGKSSKLIHLEGGMGSIPGHIIEELNGLQYEFEYGSTKRELPFAIFCKDFQLDTYDGTDVASSFASEVTVIDENKGFKKDERIFMNNVIDYGGYRFFQSAYDLDDPKTPENEEGTRLSVNFDFWGTNISYLGYLLMGIGMLLSLFAPAGRFKELLGRIDKSHKRREEKLNLKLILVLLSFSGLTAFSQETMDTIPHAHEHEEHNHEHADVPKPSMEFHYVSEEHSEKMASILVQDFQGRIVPFHTVCDQLLRKFYGKSSYQKKNAVQTIMSMHMYHDYWYTQKMIAVPQAVRERMKLGEYASIEELIEEHTGEIKWLKEYNLAHKKPDSKKDEFDKKLIKLVERLEVYSAVLQWQYLRIMPLFNDPNNTWVSPLDQNFIQQDSLRFSKTFNYFSALHKGSTEKTWGVAEDLLTDLKAHQRKVANNELPTESLVNLEIRYNNMNIFKNSMYCYLILGLTLLFLFFIRIFINPSRATEKIFKRVSMPLYILLILTFVYHASGLIMRWYISGHAPWSNGYEAVVFIAWVTMVAGFSFSRKSPVVPAACAILAFCMIFVTELSLLDPEISPLQPVLKSYWLKIHVAIITGSYGFLGLGAILGFFNLFLYIFRFKSNGKRITEHINEITAISELTITIGLFMLTIGTFLGGIWANESWGRYWGWDPKETWALVSVLTFAIVLHLRYIPFLKGKFVFNFASFWAYGSILFTFFGVNFYLVGLHSYAQGEGLAEIPNWIIFTVIGFLLFSGFSLYRYASYKTMLKNEILHKNEDI